MQANVIKKSQPGATETLKKPRLIIGLGNPGDEYGSTYHNVGHLFINFIGEKLDAEKKSWLKFKENLRYFKRGHQYFCQTQGFMNLSGAAVKDAIKIAKVKPEEILIIHDDSDIKVGSYKFSIEKNSAGHKGIDSIIKTIGTKKFWRLRIGIRPNKEKTRSKAGAFVLKKIKPEDKKTFYSLFNGIIEKVIEKENP